MESWKVWLQPGNSELSKILPPTHPNNERMQHGCCDGVGDGADGADGDNGGDGGGGGDI